MLSDWVMIGRLLCAAVLGGMVGLERERLLWAAGLRTHMLVCIGSCLAIIVSAYGFHDVLGEKNVVLDPSRIAAQVVSGVGFLGAGTILFRGEAVEGLTTAASLWAVAGIGLAAGSGLYVAAIVSTAVILAVLAGLTRELERRRGLQLIRRQGDRAVVGGGGAALHPTRRLGGHGRHSVGPRHAVASRGRDRATQGRRDCCRSARSAVSSGRTTGGHGSIRIAGRLGRHSQGGRRGDRGAVVRGRVRAGRGNCWPQLLRHGLIGEVHLIERHGDILLADAEKAADADHDGCCRAAVVQEDLGDGAHLLGAWAEDGDAAQLRRAPHLRTFLGQEVGRLRVGSARERRQENGSGCRRNGRSAHGGFLARDLG